MIDLSSRFLRVWLRDGYSNKAAIERNRALSDDAKEVLLGILMRSENRIVRTYPSQMDWDFLSDQYSALLPSNKKNPLTSLQHLAIVGLGTSTEIPFMDGIRSSLSVALANWSSILIKEVTYNYNTTTCISMSENF